MNYTFHMPLQNRMPLILWTMLFLEGCGPERMGFQTSVYGTSLNLSHAVQILSLSSGEMWIARPFLLEVVSWDSVHATCLLFPQVHSNSLLTPWNKMLSEWTSLKRLVSQSQVYNTFIMFPHPHLKFLFSGQKISVERCRTHRLAL